MEFGDEGAVGALIFCAGGKGAVPLVAARLKISKKLTFVDLNS